MGFVTLVVYYTETNESESAAIEVTYLVNTGDNWRTKAWPSLLILTELLQICQPIIDLMTCAFQLVH